MTTTPPDHGRAPFSAAVEQMELLLVALQAAPKFPFLSHPEVPQVPGIYLFSEDSVPSFRSQCRFSRNALLRVRDPNARGVPTQPIPGRDESDPPPEL